MSWVLLYVPDMIIIPIFICLLVLIYLSKYDIHHTPFYSFFISSGKIGICGIAAIVTHFLYNQMTYSPDKFWIIQLIFIINENGIFGATIGKFYIALHRYCAMRQFVINERVWSSRAVRILILIQFILPTASSIFFALPEYSQMIVIEGRAVISVDNKALQASIIQKYVNLSVFSFYCVSCLLLTYLSNKRLSSLGRTLEVVCTPIIHYHGGNSRQTVLKQQHNLLMIVTVCFISHILKALQQFSVIIISYYQIDRQTYLTILWPACVLTNGLATYSPAVILVILSPKIRSLFRDCLRRPPHLFSLSAPMSVALQRFT